MSERDSTYREHDALGGTLSTAELVMAAEPGSGGTAVSDEASLMAVEEKSTVINEES